MQVPSAATTLEQYPNLPDASQQIALLDCIVALEASVMFPVALKFPVMLNLSGGVAPAPMARLPEKTKDLYIANVYKCNMIVSNTSTLILLAKVDSLSILLDNIKKISIPKIVYEEIANKKDSFEFLTIKKEIGKNRIVLIDVGKKSYSSILAQFKLDEGEAAAYALFKTAKGKAILTDDRELIKLCKIENVPFITAMAVVVKLFRKKKLTKEEALEKLEKLNGYGRYSEDIYDFFKLEIAR